MSTQKCLGKSPNKHNRLWLTATPFPEGLSEAVEKKEIFPSQEPKQRARLLETEYGFNSDDSRKVWTFGPNEEGPNMLFDVTKGVQYLKEVKDHCCGAFHDCTVSGILTKEPTRGIRWDIHDAQLHSDNIHRSAGQLVPAMRKAMIASFLLGEPRIMEPIFLVEIQGPGSCVGGVYACISTRRGEVISEELVGNRTIIKLYLPVSESFGFSEHLRSMTSGEAFPQCVFDHWKVLDSDPMLEGTQANKTVMEIRKRKGMKDELPNYKDYLDKL